MVKIDYLSELIDVPENVKVEVNGGVVKVSGPKGQLMRDFSKSGIKISSLPDGKVLLEVWNANRKLKAMIGTVASHIRNMIKGVTQGFRYELKVVYAHFPISVKVKEDRVVIENFLGERSPRVARIVGNVKVTVSGDTIVVEGIDKEQVSQTAANIHLATHIKGLDPRVFMDGIYIVKKGVMASG
ncbi:MAG: 50S ribosomal protein L6 [Thermoprotei archaeon]|nr:MAG: 50S ribosomal protein L6 [Thermoprotei archaeon]